MPKYLFKSHGFGLAELLVTVGLVGVVSLGVNRLFVSGIKASRHLAAKGDLAAVRRTIQNVIDCSRTLPLTQTCPAPVTLRDRANNDIAPGGRIGDYDIQASCTQASSSAPKILLVQAKLAYGSPDPLTTRYATYSNLFGPNESVCAATPPTGSCPPGSAYCDVTTDTAITRTGDLQMWPKKPGTSTCNPSLVSLDAFATVGNPSKSPYGAVGHYNPRGSGTYGAPYADLHLTGWGGVAYCWTDPVTKAPDPAYQAVGGGGTCSVPSQWQYCRVHNGPGDLFAGVDCDATFPTIIIGGVMLQNGPIFPNVPGTGIPDPSKPAIGWLVTCCANDSDGAGSYSGDTPDSGKIDHGPVVLTPDPLAGPPNWGALLNPNYPGPPPNPRRVPSGVFVNCIPIAK